MPRKKPEKPAEPFKPEFILPAWQKFATFQVPKDAPVAQKREMQKCYYAGGAAMILILKNVGILGDDPQPPEVKRLLMEINTYMLAYNQELNHRN